MAAAVWFVPHSPEVLIAIMVAAAVSDVLDGRFARAIRKRRLNKGQDPGKLADVGGVGAWLDPLCDKIFVISLLGAIFVSHRPDVWVVVLIATRELFLVPMGIGYRVSARARKALAGFDFRAGWYGKLATVTQFSAVAAIPIAPRAVVPLAVAAAVCGVIATIRYTQRALTRVRDNVKTAPERVTPEKMPPAGVFGVRKLSNL